MYSERDTSDEKIVVEFLNNCGYAATAPTIILDMAIKAGIPPDWKKHFELIDRMKERGLIIEVESQTESRYGIPSYTTPKAWEKLKTLKRYQKQKVNS